MRCVLGLAVGLGLATLGLADPPKPQWQRMLTGEDAKSAKALEDKLAAVKKAEKTDEALKLAEEVLALRTRVQGADHWEVKDAEWVVTDLKRPLTAEQRKELAAAARMSEEATTLYQKGKLAAAGALVEAAYRTSTRILGDTHPDTALRLNFFAVLHLAQGRPADAEPLLLEAVPAIRAALGPVHPKIAECVSNLAAVYHGQGRYTDAEPLLRDALRIHTAALGDAHPDTARTQSNLAEVIHALGRYADAETLHERALMARWAALGDAHPDTATSLLVLGNLYAAQGRPADAAALLCAAVRVYRAAVGEVHPRTARSMSALGTLYLSEGRPGDAEPLLQDSVRTLRAVYGDVHPDTAGGLIELAALYIARGRTAEAEPLLNEALRTHRATLGEAHPVTARTLSKVAALYVAQGRPAASEPLLTDALRVYRAALGDAHTITAQSFSNLAVLYHGSGRYKHAEGLYRNAVRGEEVSRLLRARGSSWGVDPLGSNPYPFLAALTAARGEPAEAFRVFEADSGRGLLDEVSARIGPGLTPAEQAQRTSAANRLAVVDIRLLKLVTQPKPTDAERAERETLAAERRRLTDELAGLAATLSRRQVADLPALQRSLPSDAALVAWIDATAAGRVQEHWGCVVRSTGEPKWERLPGTGPENKWSKDDDALPGRLRAALAGSASAADVADLAKKLHAQRLAPLAKHLAGVKTLYVLPVRQMAGVPVEALTADYTVHYVPSGTFLARLKDRPPVAGRGLLAVGDPVYPPPTKAVAAGLPPGGLLVSQVLPGGAAAQVSIKPGDVLLRYAGQELTSLDKLKELVTENDKAKTNPVVVWRAGDEPRTVDVPPGKLGVILDPDPAPQAVAARRKLDAQLAVSARGGEWDELPGTAAELKSLRELFPDATTLTRSEASPKRLADLHADKSLAGYRYLHFAAHGEGNAVRAFESALILSGDDKSVGKLTARHVLDNWQLDAELVTLSACETAVGQAAGGDGPLGFAQAFLTAGARSVCLSLWKVDDAATCLLMDRFYRNLLGKRGRLDQPMGKAAALAEAKAWLRSLPADQAAGRLASVAKGVARGAGETPLPALAAPPADAAGPPFAHPKYWAAFVLIGDPG